MLPLFSHNVQQGFRQPYVFLWDITTCKKIHNTKIQYDVQIYRKSMAHKKGESLNILDDILDKFSQFIYFIQAYI